MAERINIGSKVELVGSVKKELTTYHQFSSGMSGVNPININNEFVVKYFSGSNIGVENSNGDPYSLNRDRFKLKEVQN